MSQIINLEDQLQRDVAARLRAQPLFSGPPTIPVIVRDEGELRAAMDEAVELAGICVAIGVPKVVAGPQVDSDIATIILFVREAPDINRGGSGTGKRARDVAIAVEAALRFWTPEPWTWLQFKRRELAHAIGNLIWEVEFTTMVGVHVGEDEPISVPEIGNA